MTTRSDHRLNILNTWVEEFQMSACLVFRLLHSVLILKLCLYSFRRVIQSSYFHMNCLALLIVWFKKVEDDLPKLLNFLSPILRSNKEKYLATKSHENDWEDDHHSGQGESHPTIFVSFSWSFNGYFIKPFYKLAEYFFRHSGTYASMCLAKILCIFHYFQEF